MKLSQYALAETADALTMEQLNKLTAWRDWHNGDYFSHHDTIKGQWFEMNLRGMLAVFNASADYDGLESWLSEVKGASKIYRAICGDEKNWSVTK